MAGRLGGTARGARPVVGAFVLALAAGASPRPAAAQRVAPPVAASDAITIVWTAPAACPDGRHVDAAVDRLLGGPPRDTGGRSSFVTGVLTARDDGAFDLVLETVDERGHRGRRVLTGATCRALADAAALVIALGWDPAAVARARPAAATSSPPEPGATAPPPAPPPPPPGPPDAATPPAPAAPPSRPGPVVEPPRPPSSPPPRPSADPDATRLGLGVALVAEAGGLPGLSVGVAGAASLLLGAYRVELGGTGIPAAEAALEGDAQRGGRFGQVLGAAALCRAVAPWRGGGAGHEASVCVGVEGGAILATGFGVDEERDATQPWLAPRAGVSGRLELARGLGLRGDLAVAVPLLRDTFLLDQLGEVHRPAPVSGRAQAGLDLRF